MRVRIVDEETLSSPNTRNIRSYLRIRGWQRRESTVKPDVWTLETQEGTYEILAPSPGARDFPERVAELLRTLSIAEERSEVDVLRDLTTLSFDIQYVRTVNEGPPGTAPIRDAAVAVTAAQNLLAAAASSLEYPRIILPPRRPAQTVEFMKKVLAGPTTAGSYVISLWVPVPPRLTHEEDAVLFEISEEPFERAATRQLQKAVVAARAATDEAIDRGIEPFVERAASGLSANLCESLVQLAGEEERGFELQFSWALDRPMLDQSPRIAFEAESIPVLREVARELRAQVPEEDVRVRGIVVRLHREKKLGPGEVTISGTFAGDPGEKSRRIHVLLTQDAYAEAIAAHETHADVEVVGAVYIRGTHTYLRDARAFRVFPPTRDS